MPAIHVLCVDDDADIRNVLRTLIDRADGLACVGTLETANELASEAASHKADVVLVDIGIPGCDTIDEVRKLAMSGWGAKIIAFSGATGTDAEHDVLAAGADAFVAKGLDPMKLIDAIRIVTLRGT